MMYCCTLTFLFRDTCFCVCSICVFRTRARACVCPYPIMHVIFTRHRYTQKKAAEIFEEAQEGGKGFCGTYPEEEAELYVEQFTRCEPIIYADMEKEGAQQGAQDGAGA